MKKEPLKNLKINQSKWENIAGFLIPWMRTKNKHTLKQYYNLHHSKKKLPFTLLDVICMLMFMSNEQIVIYDNNWKYINFTLEDDIPQGYKIIPKIIIKGE